MKNNLRKIISLILVGVIFFNVSSPITLAISNASYSYGSVVIVLKDKAGDNATFDDDEREDDSGVIEKEESDETKVLSETEKEKVDEAEVPSELEEKVDETKVSGESEKEKVDEAEIPSEPEKEKVDETKVSGEPEKEKVDEAEVPSEPEKEKVDETKVSGEPEKEKVDETKVPSEPEKGKVDEAEVPSEPEKEKVGEAEVPGEPEKGKVDEAEDEPAIDDILDATPIAFSRDGRFLSRSFRNTSRGVTSRSGVDRDALIEEKVDVEITFSNMSYIKKDISEFNSDENVIGYYEFVSDTNEFEMLYMVFELSEQVDKDVYVIYSSPTGEIFEPQTADKLSSKEYETLVFEVKSEKIDDENSAPAATEIEDSAMMARYVAINNDGTYDSNKGYQYSGMDGIDTYAEYKENYDLWDDNDIDPETDVAYFTADFWNYDARKFNYATRKKALNDAGINEALDNLDRDTQKQTLIKATKNALLFNFHANDYHYYYDKNEVNGNTSLGGYNYLSAINKPKLPWNAWHNTMIAPGLVENQLNGNGNVSFTKTEAGLFKEYNDDTRFVINENEEWIIDERLNLKFPFLKTSDGYYEFDSDEMYINNVFSIENGETLDLYKIGDSDQFPCVAKSQNNTGNGFWPFATNNDGASDEGYTNYNSGNSYLSDQYHFGMKLSAGFLIPDGKQVDTDGNKQDLTFEFTGDDDIWIFVDNTLVLDIGGCHKAIRGKINFRTGEVKYSLDGSNKIIGNEVVNEAMYNKMFDGPVTASPSTTTGDTTLQNIFSDYETRFADGTYHTINIFYLERGTGQSNCSMKFNISNVYNIDSTKNAYVNGEEVDYVYAGETVDFDIEIENNSRATLEDLIIYDKELGYMFDKKGVIYVGDDVEYSKTEMESYKNIPDSDYELLWENDYIEEAFSDFEYKDAIKINKDGIGIKNRGSSYIDYDVDLEEYISIVIPKARSFIGENTAYAIAFCDSGVVATTGITYRDTNTSTEYEVKDTELYVKQVVVDQYNNIIENAPNALVEVASSTDSRTLYFPSITDESDKYKKYTSYYFDEKYIVKPIIPADYELIAIDVDDEELNNILNKDSYNKINEFKYSDDSRKYKKYVTIYLRYIPNNDWHGMDVKLNEFLPIVLFKKEVTD